MKATGIIGNTDGENIIRGKFFSIAWNDSDSAADRCLKKGGCQVGRRSGKARLRALVRWTRSAACLLIEDSLT